MERFEPIFWDLEVVGFVIMALLGLMMAANVFNNQPMISNHLVIAHIGTICGFSNLEII